MLTEPLLGGVWQVGGTGGKQTAKALRLWIDRKNKGNHGWLNISIVAVSARRGEDKLMMFFPAK